MIRKGFIVLALVAATGCGGDEELPAASGATTTTGTTATTRTTTSVPAPSREPPPKRARSGRGCAKLWNADALPVGNYQVSANQFLAKEAPVRVQVTYERGDCYVVWPISGRRIEFSVAPSGRRPFTTPGRRPLEPGERVPYNARADREGRVVLD